MWCYTIQNLYTNTLTRLLFDWYKQIFLKTTAFSLVIQLQINLLKIWITRSMYCAKIEFAHASRLNSFETKILFRNCSRERCKLTLLHSSPYSQQWQTYFPEQMTNNSHTKRHTNHLIGTTYGGDHHNIQPIKF